MGEKRTYSDIDALAIGVGVASEVFDLDSSQFAVALIDSLIGATNSFKALSPEELVDEDFADELHETYFECISCTTRSGLITAANSIVTVLVRNGYKININPLQDGVAFGIICAHYFKENKGSLDSAQAASVAIDWLAESDAFQDDDKVGQHIESLRNSIKHSYGLLTLPGFVGIWPEPIRRFGSSHPTAAWSESYTESLRTKIAESFRNDSAFAQDLQRVLCKYLRTIETQYTRNSREWGLFNLYISRIFEDSESTRFESGEAISIVLDSSTLYNLSIFCAWLVHCSLTTKTPSSELNGSTPYLSHLGEGYIEKCKEYNGWLYVPGQGLRSPQLGMNMVSIRLATEAPGMCGRGMFGGEMSCLMQIGIRLYEHYHPVIGSSVIRLIPDTALESIARAVPYAEFVDQPARDMLSDYHAVDQAIKEAFQNLVAGKSSSCIGVLIGVIDEAVQLKYGEPLRNDERGGKSMGQYLHEIKDNRHPSRLTEASRDRGNRENLEFFSVAMAALHTRNYHAHNAYSWSVSEAWSFYVLVCRLVTLAINSVSVKD